MKNVVQPHGALLVLDARNRDVIGASESVRTVFGLSHLDLVGFPLARLSTAANLVELVKVLEGPIGDREPIVITNHCRRRLSVVTRTVEDRIVVEFEPADEAPPNPSGIMNRLRRSIARLRDADDLDDLATRAAQELGALSGFDRVVVHAFPPDGHPLEGSRSMSAAYMRFLPTTTYLPSSVHMQRNAPPPDLTGADLWSPSLDALENIRALGITASMEISMSHDGRPAGLVLGRHGSGDHFVPHDTRIACRLLSEVYSSLVSQRQRVDAGSSTHVRRAA